MKVFIVENLFLFYFRLPFSKVLLISCEKRVKSQMNRKRPQKTTKQQQKTTLKSLYPKKTLRRSHKLSCEGL